MLKIYSTLTMCILATTCFAQNTKWMVEAGTVLSSPRLVQETAINPQNFQSSTKSDIKPGLFVNIVNVPNTVFQHAFTFSRVAIGGTHSFAVIPNPQQNYPIPNPVNQTLDRMSSQFSYTIRTSIPGFVHKYGKRRNDGYSGKWDFLVGIGLGFTINHREKFNEAARNINVRQNITQGTQVAIASSGFDAIGNFTMQAPFSATVTYRVAPKLNLVASYTALLPITFMGVRSNILQSNIFIVDRQEIASLQYTQSLVRHQFGLGIQYQFYQRKNNK